jgi:hypothetical protein
MSVNGNSSVHDYTPTSRKNRKIELELSRRLDEVVNLIKREYAAGRFTTSGYAKSVLELEVYEILRSRIQQSYQLAIDYVTDLLGRENYFSRHDIDIISELTSDYSNRFWGRVETLLLDNSPGMTRMITNNFVITSLTTDITTRTLSVATVNKTQELTAVGNGSGNMVVAGIKQIEKRLAARNPGIFGTGITQEPGLVIRFQWVISLTDRTCNLCKALNGVMWDINDHTMPTPGGISNGGSHTHFNCRCRIILVESPVSQKPIRRIIPPPIANR